MLNVLNKCCISLCKAREAVGEYIRERFDCLELNDGDDRVECLWVRIRGKTSMADILVESVMDYPTRMKRQTEYSISNWKIKSYNH